LASIAVRQASTASIRRSVSSAVVDRALVDLAAFYRDVLALQVGSTIAPVHADLTHQAEHLARSSTAAIPRRGSDAVVDRGRCRARVVG